MSLSPFEQIEKVIKSRRTTKAHAMNGKAIPDEQIQKLIELADCAPNHGQTEPWRFYIFSGNTLNKFGQNHADMYWANTRETMRKESKYNKYVTYAENASHVIVAVMRPGSNPKIPEKEERSAVSAAIQNMLLGATALGIASFWSTGGMAYHAKFKKFLKLVETDKVIGLLYLGYSDNLRKTKKRKIPLAKKITWMKVGSPE